ncbi:hypothetical protein ACFQ0G_52530 [Streptomyces chiangmaiensis]
MDAGGAHGGFGVGAGAAVVMTVLALGGLRGSSPSVSKSSAPAEAAASNPRAARRGSSANRREP